jgi:hypothetical protein
VYADQILHFQVTNISVDLPNKEICLYRLIHVWTGKNTLIQRHFVHSIFILSPTPSHYPVPLSPANQDTIVELIGFFQSALPGNLLPQLGGRIQQLELKSHKDKRKKKRKEVRNKSVIHATK